MANFVRSDPKNLKISDTHFEGSCHLIFADFCRCLHCADFIILSCQQKLQVALDSHHREYKNVQESVLTNVNIQRTGKTSLQMFVYFIFDGSFICRCLYICRPSSVPPHSICPPWLEVYELIINDLYLQILHSSSENRLTILFIALYGPTAHQCADARKG